MLAFHQWGFSSGSGDRIPVPAETDQHVSLTILALPGNILFFLIIITTLITVITLQWEREASRFRQQWAPGGRVFVSKTLKMSTDPFHSWDTVGSKHFFPLCGGGQARVVHSSVNMETFMTCWSWPVLVWGHLDELINLLMVSYRLSQFSLLKQYQPPGNRNTADLISHTKQLQLLLIMNLRLKWNW